MLLQSAFITLHVQRQELLGLWKVQPRKTPLTFHYAGCWLGIFITYMVSFEKRQGPLLVKLCSSSSWEASLARILDCGFWTLDFGPVCSSCFCSDFGFGLWILQNFSPFWTLHKIRILGTMAQGWRIVYMLYPNIMSCFCFQFLSRARRND